MQNLLLPPWPQQPNFLPLMKKNQPIRHSFVLSLGRFCTLQQADLISCLQYVYVLASRQILNKATLKHLNVFLGICELHRT
ncbi:hypothetical protein LINPERHAP1_LOCUS26803 [Linum perenne]